MEKWNESTILKHFFYKRLTYHRTDEIEIAKGYETIGKIVNSKLWMNYVKLNHKSTIVYCKV